MVLSSEKNFRKEGKLKYLHLRLLLTWIAFRILSRFELTFIKQQCSAHRPSVNTGRINKHNYLKTLRILEMGGDLTQYDSLIL